MPVIGPQALAGEGGWKRVPWSDRSKLDLLLIGWSQTLTIMDNLASTL